MDRDTYLFHQTPRQCAIDLMQYIPLQSGDTVLEPFKGEGAFYDAFPNYVIKDWAELEQGRSYSDISGSYDWVITNPPYKLEEHGTNSFWPLLDYYSTRTHKGIAFLANDRCFSTLTPKRMNLLQQRNWSITKIVVCSVKKWRGRYFFLVLEKDKVGFVNYLLPNY